MNGKKAENKNKEYIYNMCICSLFVAFIAVCSQISFPMPSNVPVTLQTFAIAFAGYVLGVKKAGISIITYVLLGAVGAPVFAGFKGGFSIIIGYTGGFIIGFIFLCVLCGINIKKHFGILSGISGLLLCHLSGVLYYMYLSGIPFNKSFCLVSLPYLPKDIVSVVVAYFLARNITNKMNIKKTSL